jgi:hypothetical protein
MVYEKTVYDRSRCINLAMGENIWPNRRTCIKIYALPHKLDEMKSAELNNSIEKNCSKGNFQNGSYFFIMILLDF